MNLARWRTVAGTGSGLGLLVLVCVLVAMAWPSASARFQTTAVRQLVARTPELAKVIQGTGAYDSLLVGAPNLPVASMRTISANLRQKLSRLPLAPAGADLLALYAGFNPVLDNAPSLGTFGRQLELVYADGLGSHVRLIRGSLPSVPAGPHDLPIAVTVATAHRYGLDVGSHVTMAGTRLVVSGIFQPAAPATPFWQLDATLSVPTLVTPLSGPDYWQGGAFIGAGEITAVENDFVMDNAQLHWVFPLRLRGLTGSQARALAVSLPAALVGDGNGILASPSSPPINVYLFSGLPAVLAGFVAQADAITALLSLLAVSLTAIGAAVLLLAIWLLTERRHAEFETLQARGASRRQLALIALRGCVVQVCAGAAVGVGLASLAAPGNGQVQGWLLTGLTLLVVLTGVPLVTMRRHTTIRRTSQSRWRRPAVRRAVAEAALVLACAGGIITLRDQGLRAGGIDPYASLAPVLVAIPVAVIVIRCYPLLARLLLRVAGHRRGVTVFVGLARAIRTSGAAALPVFAMVLALTIVAFGGMFRAAVLRGDEMASWQDVGADAVVSASNPLSMTAQRAVAAVPGVTAIAALSITSGVFPSTFDQVGVVLVDPGAYAAVVAHGSGEGPVLGGGPGVPALASTSLAATMHRGSSALEIGNQSLRVRVVGQARTVSLLSAVAGDQYLILPRSAVGRGAPAPTVMLIDGTHLDHRALTAIARKSGAGVSFRSVALAAIERAPLQQDVYVAFAIGAAMAAVLSMLVLLLALVISARSRELTLARMSTMGLSGRQGRRLVIVEALPQILAAITGGLAGAVLLAPLVAPALNLSVFTGSGAAVRVRIEPVSLTAAAAALIVLATLALVMQTRFAVRSVTSELRIGE